MAESEQISIIGARVHNLKNIDLDIPRDALVVVTGLSGSGKSSLAFDTICAEGQRRYMDTLSAYARQFIGILERPDIDEIRGLSPVISIEQKTVGRNPRSTVGTITEIYDFFRLLYARASQAFSPESGKEMVRYTDEEIVSLILRQYAGQKVLLLAPLVRGRKGHYRELFVQLQRKGYTQVRIDGQLTDLAEAGPLDRYKVHFVELVVDKLIPSEDDRKRIRESVNTALGQGKGSLCILTLEDGNLQHFSRNLVCPDTGLSFEVPAPYTFSFNSPQGACPHCRGLGTVARVDLDKIIPDRGRSIADGGIESIGPMRGNTMFRYLEAIARKYKFSLHDPIRDIPEEALQVILYGSEELLRIGTSESDMEMSSFPGILSQLATGDEEESERKQARKEHFLEEMPCPVCGGTRLKKEALYFKIDGKNIAEVADMDISALYDWVKALPPRLTNRQRAIADDILKELSDRIGFLKAVGLEYLSLSRATRTLSGGESQRIRLATQIGSKLVNVLYVLDEPSIGLHQKDNRKLIDSLKTLRDEGNSVMVVEHDEEMMRSADWLVDLGPGAGEKGGRLLYNGRPSDIEAVPAGASPTIDYLLGRKAIPVPAVRRPGNGRFITLRGARGNNLKDVTLDLPLGLLVGISGVSGSGKSSLVSETLLPILSNKIYRSKYPVLPYDRIDGLSNIDKVIEIDQAPIGRSPRSNPATYTDVMTDIRRLFEATPDAKIRGFKANRFSFNVKGGRCEACKGAGLQLIEMHFLPSAQVTCKECGGKRYKPDTLAVKYKGKNISEVLDMSIAQAAEFFSAIPSVAQKLRTLEEVGLGYLTLGQPATTLSGGESQRLKLSAELSRRDTGNTLYLLDEPTTGLHFEDIQVLIGVLQRLVDRGNTVVIIEHNLDILKSVDWLIDLGPEGGAAGGTIVAAGTPEQVANTPGSYTGQYLKEIL
ncbi:MAG: excinuclease ABC subunit UvrA [Bacteroidales bacterium]|nr:excinuclease ABC subunit UvrA [Bacteroidales bacterium]MBQ5529289.1 excinuclease ABC subunit UvrA [Bacteroidales bacterium]MBR6868921.1 excinuclease ABC subunit UvrA [Bacteroidales bacterium]